ncbi:MAG: hypothetical protein WBH31_13215 [Promethearchaeia archaeon]
MKERFQAELNGVVLRSEYKDLLNKYNILVRFLKEKGILDEVTFEEVSDKETQSMFDIIDEKSK